MTEEGYAGMQSLCGLLVPYVRGTEAVDVESLDHRKEKAAM